MQAFSKQDIRDCDHADDQDTLANHGVDDGNSFRTGRDQDEIDTGGDGGHRYDHGHQKLKYSNKSTH